MLMQPYLAPVSFMVSAVGVMLWESIPTLWLGKCKADVGAATPAVASAVTGSVCRKLGPFTSFHNRSTHTNCFVGRSQREGFTWRTHHQYVQPSIFFPFLPNVLFIFLLSEHQKFINYAEQLMNHLWICRHSWRVLTRNPSRLASISFKQMYYCLPKDFGEYIFFQLIT